MFPKNENKIYKQPTPVTTAERKKDSPLESNQSWQSDQTEKFVLALGTEYLKENVKEQDYGSDDRPSDTDSLANDQLSKATSEEAGKCSALVTTTHI